MIKLSPITPRGPLFDLTSARRAIDNALDGAAKGALVDFKVTTQTWEHKPDFTIEAPSDDTRIISTDDAIYGYVDAGTKPHIIVPRRAKVLMFGPGARAKTRPRVIGSGGGSKGGATVVAHRVNHPGTEAREFSETIADKWGEQLPILLQRALEAEMR